MKQTTPAVAPFMLTSNDAHIGEDKTTLTLGSNEHEVCPVCGVVCPNRVYCINCGHVKDRRLLELQAIKIGSMEDEA